MTGPLGPPYHAATNQIYHPYHVFLPGRTRPRRRFPCNAPAYRQAIEIWGKTLGKQQPHYALSLSNLANLYRAAGNYAQAVPLYREALGILRATLGQTHPDVAGVLNQLGELYREMGAYSQSEPFHRQALKIRRAALGEHHPDFAQSLNNLATLYYATGNYALAEPISVQALEIRRAALGEQHADFAASLENLTGLYVGTHRAELALPLLQQAAAIDDRIVGQVFSISSDTQRLDFLRHVQGRMEGFLSLVFQHLPQSSAAVYAVFELVLRRKAIGAEAFAAQRDALLGGRYPDLQPPLRELSALRMEIAQKTLAGPGPEGDQVHQQVLAKWIAEKERLEAELARQIPEINLQKQLRAADRRAIALALPEGVALVEFVRFNVFDFKAEYAHRNRRWKPARYLAFVLLAGEPGNVQMIDLGEAAPIDRMIADFRSGITGEVEEQPGRDMTKRPATLMHASNATTGLALRRVVFDKLVYAISGRKRILLAPDGDLARLPFEVLPAEEGRCLIDDYQISYLSCSRDVLRFGAATSDHWTEPLVAAAPDFDLASIAPFPPSQPGVAPGRRSPDLEASVLSFSELPGTRLEGERIAGLLGVRPWLEAEVLEKRLKAVRSPRILHLATHGFFLADQHRDPSDEHHWVAAGDMGRLGGLRLENPLLRSGLALAGGNTWLQHGSLPPEAEDGLLTAEDVSALDLSGTDLVVLSACNTGVGEVRMGEGVFGLRRAFMLTR